MLTLEVYEIFKKKIGEQEATKIVAYFEDAKDREITLAVGRKIEHLATKEDIAITKADIAHTKADIIKWMFLFWLGQIAVTAGMVFAVINSK